MPPQSDGHGDVQGPDRRLAESFHLALAMEAGPVRDGLTEAVRAAGWAALSAAIAAAQKALSAARDRRFDEAAEHLAMAGEEAKEALTIPWAADGPAFSAPARPTGPAAVRRTLGSLKGEAQRRARGETT